MDGGADLLMLETVFDALNAKAAIFAIETLFAERGMRLPVIVSGTLTSSGRTWRDKPSKPSTPPSHTPNRWP